MRYLTEITYDTWNLAAERLCGRLLSLNEPLLYLLKVEIENSPGHKSPLLEIREKKRRQISTQKKIPLVGKKFFIYTSTLSSSSYIEV